MIDTKRAGFTLIEIMIVVILMTVVMGIVVYMIVVAENTVDEATVTVYLESEGNHVMDLMRDKIVECKVISPPENANNYMSISFQVPIRVGGNYWNPTSGAINWGAIMSPVEYWEDGYMTYSVITGSVRAGGVETEMINEAALRQDFDRDGNLEDSYYVGDLILDFCDKDGVIQFSQIMVRNVVPYQDTNDDGQNDIKIFALYDNKGDLTEDKAKANRLGINITLGGLLNASGQQMPMMVSSHTDVFLMNPQE